MRVLTRERDTIDQDPNKATSLNILICPDKPGWAFDNIASNIKRYAGSNRIHTLYMQDIIGNEENLFKAIFLHRIDLCHIFWRIDLFYLLHPALLAKSATALGIDFETFVRAINSCAFTTSVYDHLFSTSQDIEERRAGYAMIDGYSVSSRKLMDIYRDHQAIPDPDLVIEDGVDTARFSPVQSFRSPKDEFSIGWAGNSAWGAISQGRDIKGYHRLFTPMMELLGKDGLKVTEKVADPQKKLIPFEEMPDFYRSLDLFVCTSEMEGTPNPVLEAMACGVPVVSTDVGVVSDAFGSEQAQFILSDHTPENFANAAKKILLDTDLRNRLSRENCAQAGNWDWKIKTRAWWPFWEKALMRSMDPISSARRITYLLS